ncbi:MAG: hypothetical protein FWH14_06105, partial [Oscillospiraceae bacterium]|nr:hypothetical protein [Oscillospiraceae bacterium]
MIYTNGRYARGCVPYKIVIKECINIKDSMVQSAVLVCADTGEFDSGQSLAELAELARTAGAEVIAEIVQNRDSIDNATYIGKGKLEETAEFCRQNDVDLLIFDHELSGTQIKNIENVTDVKVVDRTMLILDIFAGRAHSKE